MARFALALIVFVVFTVYSTGVIVTEGLSGLIETHAHGGWSIQIILDLILACSFVIYWLIPDAKKLGISPWPFVVAIPIVGSIGTLAYFVVREWKRMRTPSLAEV